MTSPLDELKSMHNKLFEAKTRAALDALYVEFIGYSIVSDDPEISDDQIAEILHGYIAEVAAAAGIPYIDYAGAD